MFLKEVSKQSKSNNNKKLISFWLVFYNKGIIQLDQICLYHGKALQLFSFIFSLLLRLFKHKHTLGLCGSRRFTAHTMTRSIQVYPLFHSLTWTFPVNHPRRDEAQIFHSISTAQITFAGPLASPTRCKLDDLVPCHNSQHFNEWSGSIRTRFY